MGREDPRLVKLREIDELLFAKGWPKISPWWWGVLEELYGTGRFVGGTRFEAVLEAGRRSGKSSTIAGKVAAAELITTVDNPDGTKRPFHVIPPNDVGHFGHISAEKGQAKARLLTTKKALRALGYSFSKDNTEEFVLADTNLGAMAITATLSGVVSFTCIGALLDEEALWEDDSGANPADEVYKSLKPTTATAKYAFIWHVSAPWAEEGLHYEMTQKGDDEAQIYRRAATWEANPTLSKQDTRLLEKDYITWLRNYGAVPMKTDEAKFFPAPFIRAAAGETIEVTEHDTEGTELEIGQTLKPVRVKGAIARATSGGDMAFRRNSAAVVVLNKIGERYRYAAGKELVPGAIPLRPSTTVRALADIAKENDADAMCVDMHYVETVREVLDSLDIPLVAFPTKASEIEAAYVRARVLFADGWIDLSDADPLLVQQLRETTSKPNASGLGISNPVKGGRHGDWVSAFIAALWSIDQHLESSGGIGSRRFPRGGDDTEGVLTDEPPPEWDN